MSGTSADGIDAALVEFDSTQRPAYTIRAAVDCPYKPEFRHQLLDIALNNECSKMQLGTVSAQLADLFAEAVNRLLKSENLTASAITAIGSHGHTIDHAPNNPLPYTLQITDHARLTEKTGITTVCDFRSRDVAAGGQGAPLVPAFHRWLFAQNSDNRPKGQAIINIGGISNITLLEAGLGYDCGPGNCLMDHWHYIHTTENFDHAGETARKGRLLTNLLESMLAEPYFSIPAPKSTGREYFNQQWLEPFLIGHDYLWQDVAHTLTALTAHVITNQLKAHHCKSAFICGGGSHNQLLIEMIEQQSDTDTVITTTHDLGIDPDWMEAAAFAWLAQQTLEGLPGNLPSATGASGYRILGAIYPV